MRERPTSHSIWLVHVGQADDRVGAPIEVLIVEGLCDGLPATHDHHGVVGEVNPHHIAIAGPEMVVGDVGFGGVDVGGVAQERGSEGACHRNEETKSYNVIGVF